LKFGRGAEDDESSDTLPLLLIASPREPETTSQPHE
jgi:hypothetical protein